MTFCQKIIQKLSSHRLSTATNVYKIHTFHESFVMSNTASISGKMKTFIAKVDPSKIGQVEAVEKGFWIRDWKLKLTESEDAKNLVEAARRLREENIPVAFPTETVYGLGADATRSVAVEAIYKAKQRPADNPLIVHFASVNQITDIVSSIPSVYEPLIRKFWPGPLTILLSLPTPSPFASEVSSGLSTFGARIPSAPVALALIKLANVPIAAPSANASTKPSPTEAHHVARDLDGRIEMIIDGGPCHVGVESTVVDGLSNPPMILRPGGIGIEQIQDCEGWDHVQIGYHDMALTQGEVPRAPGMKYRHYSPQAQVVLHEASSDAPSFMKVARASEWNVVGFVRTRNWRKHEIFSDSQSHLAPSILAAVANLTPTARKLTIHDKLTGSQLTAWVVDLGSDAKEIARGLFSALRDLDTRGVKCIFVEGIDDKEGDVSAAVMNRLRKAAG